MGFKFAARTLLELGKELISSDEVAINELVKNSIDAGSPSVHCIFNVVVTHGHYQRALDDLKDGKSSAEVFAQLERSVLASAPEESRSAFLEVLRQAVADRDDFEQNLSAAYARFNWIEVRDQGHGMSMDELDAVYLTVGTRSRRRENLAGATYLGDKGVGRLSTMRLGSRLDIKTTCNGERHFNLLTIDWNQFGHDVERDVADILIAPTTGEPKAERTIHGTVIRISDLSGDWPKERLNELLTGPVARMIDPFEKGRANKLLRFEHNGERLLVPNVPEQLLRAAHASCVVQLKFEGDEPVFEGLLDYRLRNAKRVVNQRGVELYSLTQRETSVRGKRGHAAIVATPIRPEVLRQLGPFQVEIYWFNRLIVEAIDGLTAKTRESREEIARWAGGPMLYRYGFRVLPYGNPDDDWLELDKKAFGQAGFKLNRQQIIGRVRVTSAHTALSEQTNREGLVDSPAASALKALLMWLVHVELRDLINAADDDERLNRRQAEVVAEGFWDTEKKVRASIQELRANVPDTNRVMVERIDKSVATLAEQCAQVLSKTEAVIKESADEREKFVHLAGIGLMTEFIFHELDRSIAFALTELEYARREHPQSTVLKNLDDQLKTLSKRVAAFDSLTGEKRQVKTNFEIGEVVTTVLSGHANQFERHGITANVTQDGPVYVRAVRGMLIQILENLISNSVYWLKQQARYEPGFAPRIEINLQSVQKSIFVTDNGPGVDPERQETIFRAFVTSKPVNQGRGLGLYISRELADYHGWKLHMDIGAETTRPGRLNTFVLEVGGEK
ncbi:sensor histidine kinase [Paraburkholderia caribensis]|uniref:histidine kinase n=1 Tax=Paraburkholderia caribensis TaxID=75105 RepID=A0A9Q6S0F8_9BURK|nr:sensor histidine kinase [Paraburkholderia caribensis]MCO4875585.1 ATP-binding protein [Paraburkholderia caribensis]PTB30495.1 hypothetical protein C9I56_01735 [Paraburkholderia caribensis]QLB62263.1 hypothetical protein A9O66_07640 [Paraburkholderia caribensis]